MSCMLVHVMSPPQQLSPDWSLQGCRPHSTGVPTAGAARCSCVVRLKLAHPHCTPAHPSYSSNTRYSRMNSSDPQPRRTTQPSKAGTDTTPRKATRVNQYRRFFCSLTLLTSTPVPNKSCMPSMLSFIRFMPLSLFPLAPARLMTGLRPSLRISPALRGFEVACPYNMFPVPRYP